mmetsp:Transcript_13983/g.20926  ORF Transcript_13983/g.20926 Transcript_13983/m.20926 type:complete len:512 (-) Transcript_13983:122-1657(-)|eukprot:CAMPEP_0185038752 /NCGR_PEP_ID=MMETSP1103-20130426/34810_1 /TAXON_ID=36769 /ORGANISM="Paraphysomonas bandaiensis, Strain Caron Lab Isolate" /LENGTH=511 /DNA_ID=CAMNT_0027577323 /DNA_START=69 /DNA_END=1604 /DNA_ORIENTATION=-
MPIRFHDAVEYHLKAFTGDERRDVLKMLATIGMLAYFESTESRNLSKSSLKLYFDKAEGILTSFRYRRIPNTVTAPEGKVMRSKTRHSRADALFHYPFCDEFGGVQDILSTVNSDLSGINSSSTLQEATAPGLKHMIEKVFHEMKIGSGGMRASDIPEALKMLGLPGRVDSSDGLNKHNLIPLEQWNMIVRRLLVSESVHRDVPDTGRTSLSSRPQSSRSRNSEAGSRSTRARDHHNRVHEYNYDLDSDDGDFLYEKDDGEESTERFDEDEHEREAEYNPPSYLKPTACRSAAALRPTAQRSPQCTKAKTKENFTAKRVSHRAQIREDRRHWRRVKENRTEAALGSIGTARVNSLIENSRHPNKLGVSSYRHTQSHGRTKNADLSSGSSSIAIADAFLDGPLGQQLLGSTKSQLECARDTGDSDEEVEDIRITQLLGQGENGGASPRPASAPVTSRPTVNETSKPSPELSYYSGNWRNTKGGWVADFGPPHTHALSVQAYDHKDDRVEVSE